MFMVIQEARRLDTRSVSQPGDARSLCAFCPSAREKTSFCETNPIFTLGSTASRFCLLRNEPNFSVASGRSSTFAASGAQRPQPDAEQSGHWAQARAQRASLIHPTVNRG